MNIFKKRQSPQQQIQELNMILHSVVLNAHYEVPLELYVDDLKYFANKDPGAIREAFSNVVFYFIENALKGEGDKLGRLLLAEIKRKK